jgi:hypothetical protein
MNGNQSSEIFGEDKVNWPAVFSFRETKGKAQWYLLGHETSKDPIGAVRRSFAALRKLGKA